MSSYLHLRKTIRAVLKTVNVNSGKKMWTMKCTQTDRGVLERRDTCISLLFKIRDDDQLQLSISVSVRIHCDVLKSVILYCTYWYPVHYYSVNEPIALNDPYLLSAADSSIIVLACLRCDSWGQAAAFRGTVYLQSNINCNLLFA